MRLADPQQGRLADGRAAASRARDRQGAPCRRSGRRGDRRDEAAGEGRGRADRHRLPGPAGGGLVARCDRAGRRAGARRRAGQHLLRLAYRRQGAGGRRVRQCREGGQARSDQQPADPERDGAARRGRRLRYRQRRLHAVHHQPEPACDPPADGRLRAAHPGEQAARGRARRGRRLRLEDLPLRRGSDRHLGRRQGARVR